MIRSYFYRELTCLPGEEISTGFVMSRVMTQVHLALVESQVQDNDQSYSRVGLAFPGYAITTVRTGETKVRIGDKLRLFGESEESLDELRLEHWLRRLLDYVHVTSTRQPKSIEEFVKFRRIQTKSSAARLARRQTRRSGKPASQIETELATFEERRLELPYIDLGSQSSGRRFRLFVRREESAESSLWRFSTYGLSSTTSVPSF